MNLGQIQPLVKGYMKLTQTLFMRVNDYLQGNGGAISDADASELLKITANFAAGGVNVMNTLRSSLGLGYIENRQLYEAQTAFETMRGLLIEIDLPAVIPNYDSLLSSSAGAEAFNAPISNYENTNPFTELFATKIGIPYSTKAAESMKFLSDMDTVLYPVTLDVLSYHLQMIYEGVSL